MVDSKGFLGKGIKFPFQVDAVTGKIMMSDYEEDIKEAIKIILMTYRGERVMQPEFGSRIQNYMFEENDQAVLTMLKHDIIDALISWEPRIENLMIDVSVSGDDKNVALANISYVVRNTNNMFNLVYPFYLMEGVK